MSGGKRPVLVDQGLALDLFLQALLREPDPPLPAVPGQEAAREPEAPVEPAQVPAPAAAPDLPEAAAEPAAPAPPAVAGSGALAPAPERFDIPAWAGEPFQVLLFRAGGLTLAVPLVELSGVLEWPEHITPMPGHADFYLGLVNNHGIKVPVVDTARLVLPARALARLAGEDPLARVNRIVLIDEGRWGLACDQVAEVVTLEPGAVRWRTERPRQPWIAGTVVAHMCALLDAGEFARRLRQGRPAGGD